jgi:hypothetical protein
VIVTAAHLTDLDRRQAERVAQSKAARGEASTTPGDDSQAAANAEPQPKPRNGDRWATYNAFIDHIAPRLTLAERAVWHVMFRHARDGKCETTARQLAVAANISASTAQLALNRLHWAGLVWPIWKSKDRAKASKYGIHPRPAECLPRLLQHTNRTDDRHGCQTNRTD